MDNNSTEMTKEDEMNIMHGLNQKNIKQNKFPMLIPTMTKIIKRKKNNNSRVDSKLKKNQLLIDYNKTSVNINNFRRNLPKIMTSYTPIERRHKYTNNSKNKNNKENKTYNLSRNFDISLLNNCNSDNNNNNYFSNNDNYDSNNNNNYLTTNNINSLNNKNAKIKLDINKKNLMNKMKHPSKINFNINKKNLKYKLPIDMINNLNQKRKQKYNNNDISNLSPNNNRKLNIRQKNNNIYTNLNNSLNKQKELNIESTFMKFNNLVSQAKELGHILIDNKDLLKNRNLNNLIENEDNVNDYFLSNNIEMKSEINKLNQEIKKEYKGVEELQKINSELNNKIILFNDNAKQYEKKVDELISVITKVKNNNNNSNNNSDNISNGISNNNNTNILRKNSSNNFTIEKIPKKKKIKFGFVELIFMKDDKFEYIQKIPPPKYEKSENKNFLIKKNEPKLVFVNMNKNYKNGNKNIIKLKATNEEYLDAASQMANQIIIESLISLKNE